MKKVIFLLFVFVFTSVNSQINYSDSWEDFFSYNNVKDIIKVNDVIYALSENAIFTYNTRTLEINKISSVQGLSGETASAIYYSQTFDRIVIGYENGLIEVVNGDDSITVSADIVSFNQTGEKSINHISEFNGTLYVSTSFALIEYDIDALEFGDTFFIGDNSSDIKINQTIVFNNQIYAATENGIYIADTNNNNLIDFNSWQASFLGTAFSNITNFNNQVYVSSNANLYRLDNGNLQLVRTFSQNIIKLQSDANTLSIALNTEAFVLNTSLIEQAQFTNTSDFRFSLNSIFTDGNETFLGTKEFGILSANVSQPAAFTEIHPDGPVSNDIFSITASNQNLWVVYGGYALSAYAPLNTRLGFSFFNGENWNTTNYSTSLPFADLVDVTVDPENNNRIFISSFGDTRDINTINTGGLMEVVDNEITRFYNQNNSILEDIVPSDPTRVTIRIAGTSFDSNGNLWIANAGVSQELKKLSPSGSFTGFDISSVKSNSSFGLLDIAIDRNNSVWLATRGDGVVVFNETGNQIKSLTTTATQGSLPNLRVTSLAVDSDNRVWIGTLSGLVVLNNASSVFSESVDARPIIFLENGIARRLLDEETVNTIVVDGANNKWFGTDNGGVVYTNPNGQTTLATFNKENSPLPSNRITKIAVDKISGKAYFATDKGMVAYDSNVAPFGEILGEVYAYPNPARKNHQTITIDGRNGTNLPKGTNVKILDVAGNLVFETNVIEGQQVNGGKVVWDKRNLAGNKVASGVYIVLLSNEDATETSTTKIAIIN